MSRHGCCEKGVFMNKGKKKKKQKRKQYKTLSLENVEIIKKRVLEEIEEGRQHKGTSDDIDQLHFHRFTKEYVIGGPLTKAVNEAVKAINALYKKIGDASKEQELIRVWREIWKERVIQSDK